MSVMASASAYEVPNGFWQIVATPRDTAIATNSRCVAGGVIRSTRSGLSLTSAASKLAYTLAMPKRSASACALATSRLTMATHSAESMRCQPMYWNWLK